MGRTDLARPKPAEATQATRRDSARGDSALSIAAAAFALATGFTSVVTVRDHLPGRPFGIGIPLSVPAAILVGWGGAVAAPWPLPVGGLVAATRAKDPDRGAAPALACAAIGTAAIVGLLIEPNSYHRTTWTRATRAAFVAHLAFSGLLATCGLRRARQIGRDRPHREQRQSPQTPAAGSTLGRWMS